MLLIGIPFLILIIYVGYIEYTNKKMKLEIRRNIPQVETIEIELPYYCKRKVKDFEYSTTIVYHKIEKLTSISITETTECDYDEAFYEIRKDEHFSVQNSFLVDYYDKIIPSTKEEFEEVKSRLMTFIVKC